MEKLQALNNEKLIEVVKNHRQYGYDLETRKAAIELLKVRGINQDTLQMTGNFDNDTYNRALSLYHSFLNKTSWALVSYVLLFILRLGKTFLNPDYEMIVIVVFVLLFLCFLLLLIQSFLVQAAFYNLLDEKQGAESIVLYLVLGLPFYFVLFFYFRKQMREKLNSVS